MPEMPDPPDRAGRCHRSRTARVGGLAGHPGGLAAQAGLTQFLRRADQRDLVPRRDLEVTAGADLHVAAVGRDDGDRRQRPVQLTEAARPRHDNPRRDKEFSGQPDLPRGRAQARLHDRRSRQPRGIQHRHPDLGQRPAHGRVSQLHDHPDIRPELTGQQRSFQRIQVVLLYADHRRGTGQAGLREVFRQPRAADDMRHAPAGQDRGQPHVRIVVDDHRRDPGQAQLLHDAQSDTAKSADDHMSAPVRINTRHLA